MSDACPRCGAIPHTGDELCRRCGTDLPARPADHGLPQAPALALDSDRFSLPWMVIAICGYVALLYGMFQIFRGGFAEYAPFLSKIRSADELRAHAGVLSELALKAFALVFCCYLAGGLLLGRFARGRVLLQSTLGALVSWLVIFLQGGVGGPLFLPMVVGAAIVTGTAALGAWVGKALRPRPSAPRA